MTGQEIEQIFSLEEVKIIISLLRILSQSKLLFMGVRVRLQLFSLLYWDVAVCV